MHQSCKPYRGYAVDVRVVPSHIIAFSGMQRRYAVSWSIYSTNDRIAPVASFPERVDFISHDAAFLYGEKRAQAFIDCMFACESH